MGAWASLEKLWKCTSTTSFSTQSVEDLPTCTTCLVIFFGKGFVQSAFDGDTTFLLVFADGEGGMVFILVVVLVARFHFMRVRLWLIFVQHGWRRFVTLWSCFAMSLAVHDRVINDVLRIGATIRTCAQHRVFLRC